MRISARLGVESLQNTADNLRLVLHYTHTYADSVGCRRSCARPGGSQGQTRRVSSGGAWARGPPAGVGAIRIGGEFGVSGVLD